MPKSEQTAFKISKLKKQSMRTKTSYGVPKKDKSKK